MTWLAISVVLATDLASAKAALAIPFCAVVRLAQHLTV